MQFNHHTILSTHIYTQAFLSGETVSGLLHFTLTDAKNYKYIEIRLYGGAEVRWSETYNNGMDQKKPTAVVL